jgi:hypothetical protein
MVILNLFIISIIWVLILDLSGFALTIDKTLYKIFYKNRPFREDAHFKPFDCSLCMTWWSCLIYLIVVNALTLPNIAFSLLFAWLTTTEKDIFILLKDIIVKLVEIIYKTFNL